MSLSRCLCQCTGRQARWGGVGEVQSVAVAVSVCMSCPWCFYINGQQNCMLLHPCLSCLNTKFIASPPPYVSWFSCPHQGFFTFFTGDKLDADSLRLRCNVTHKTISSTTVPLHAVRGQSICAHSYFYSMLARLPSELSMNSECCSMYDRLPVVKTA